MYMGYARWLISQKFNDNSASWPGWLVDFFLKPAAFLPDLSPINRNQAADAIAIFTHPVSVIAQTSILCWPLGSISPHYSIYRTYGTHSVTQPLVSVTAMSSLPGLEMSLQLPAVKHTLCKDPDGVSYPCDGLAPFAPKQQCHSQSPHHHTSLLQMTPQGSIY